MHRHQGMHRPAGPSPETTDPNELEKNDSSGSSDDSNAQGKVPETADFRDRMAHFTWPWFATVMSTGALAVVLGDTPNRFHGLDVIGTIYYILTIVLFLLFTAGMTLRAIWYPKRFLSSLHHPVDGMFFGAYWVAVALILEGAQIFGVPHCGPWLPRALYIVFWIYSAIVIIVGVAQYYLLFQEERLDISNAVPAWIFPIYPLLVIGPLAGTLIPSQPDHRAFDMWVGAVMMQGLGWIVALMMYCMYTQRLMTSALPPPPTRPGMFVSVGPAGYTAAGLISLGRQAKKILPNDSFHVLGVQDGDIVGIVGIIAGIFIVIFAFWFFCISSLAVISGSRRMTFTLNWWALVFPNAGLTLAAIQVGGVFKSPGINGVCSALTILITILWFVCAIAHIRALWLRQILWPGKDEDKDQNRSWGKFSA